MQTNDIKRHFTTDLGIKKDDIVFLFSSLQLFDMRQLHVKEILETLESILCDGILILPTFTFNSQIIKNFDKSKKNCLEMGALALESVGRIGYTRTTHPIFSVSMWSNSESKKSSLIPTSNDAFGKGSFFSKLMEINQMVKIVLFGNPFPDTFYRSTFIHSAQQEVDSWHRYLKAFYSGYELQEEFTAFVRFKSLQEFILKSNIKKKFRYVSRRFPRFPVVEKFDDFGRDLIKKELLLEYKFGYSKSKIVEAQPAHRLFVENMLKNPYYCLN